MSLSKQDLRRVYSNHNVPYNETALPELLKSSRLSQTVILQVVDVRNISKSNINQIEDLVACINPNESSSDFLRTPKNTPALVRSVDLNTQTTNEPPKNNSRHYKFTLMDFKENLCYAVELTHLKYPANQGITPVTIGTNVVVKQGTKIAESVLLLSDTLTEFVDVAAPDPAFARVTLERLRDEVDNYPEH